jgi:high-affinity iron transporter
MSKSATLGRLQTHSSRALTSMATLFGALLLLTGVAIPSRLASQERPAKRVANIVGVAVEEYGKAVDATGKLVSDIEYAEAVDFLADARTSAERLSGEGMASARAVLDSLIVFVQARRPPDELRALEERFRAALGADAALDLPTRPVNVVAGGTLYARHCASCHGTTGGGDGPAAAGMQPPPPALGDPAAMHDVTPALMYRVVSVGMAGTPMIGWASTLSPDERWDVVAYINSLRGPKPAIAGEGLYAQRCAGCHGPAGRADGPLATALSKLPAELSSFGWQAEKSDAAIAAIVREGVAGTAMPGSRDLTSAELSQVVAHLRLLALRDVPTTIAGNDNTRESPEATARRVVATLDEALTAARAGRTSDANDRAFDAYIAFEPLETPARARNPGLVATMERYFADFKGSVRANDLRLAERTRNTIEAGMPAIVELTSPPGSGWGAFLQSLLIILREGVEAILVIGAIVTFLIKTGNRERLRAIWLGVGAALVASALTAIVLATVLRALPATREIIEGVTMLIAVGVLFSVSYWLISKVEAAKWQQFIREKVTNALQHGGGKALAIVAFLAVYREGAETALFYQALFREGANVVLPISLGIAVGAVGLAIIFVLFYRYGIRIPLRPFFAGTSALLYYMAFVFMGKGIRELQEGNVVPITTLPGWPHVDAMGIFPSVETLVAQALLVVLFVFALVKSFWPKRSVTLPTVEPPPATPVASEDEVEELRRRVEQLEAQVHALEEKAPALRSTY